MGQYINKSKVVAEIEKMRDEAYPQSDWNHGYTTSCEKILSFLNTLEVKEVDLDKFKSLQHISGDLKSTLQDWGYAPNLYHFDGNWHVDWISCEEGDSIKGFTGDTAEEAINKAYDWFHSTFCNS